MTSIPKIYRIEKEDCGVYWTTTGLRESKSEIWKLLYRKTMGPWELLCVIHGFKPLAVTSLNPYLTMGQIIDKDPKTGKTIYEQATSGT